MLDTLPEDIQKRIEPEPTSGCWLWVGAPLCAGYGSYQHKRAHRVVFQLLRGNIPGDMVLDHLCRVRSCVNPAHLEIVTPGENARRALLKSKCKYGHDRLDLRGTCRLCMRQRMWRLYAPKVGRRPQVGRPRVY